MTLAEFLAARLDEMEAEGAGSQTMISRQVAAMRAILDEHQPGYPVTYPKKSGQPTCGVCHAGGWDWEPQQWPCPTVRAVAAIFADHPDYRQGWAA